jgi:hypothetical protein
MQSPPLFFAISSLPTLSIVVYISLPLQINLTIFFLSIAVVNFAWDHTLAFDATNTRLSPALAIQQRFCLIKRIAAVVPAVDANPSDLQSHN